MWTEFVGAWDRFWFQPRSSHTLAVIRIATGSMLAYIHWIWYVRLDDFLGPNAFTSCEWVRNFHALDYTWSYLWSIDSMAFLRVHQWLAIWLAILMAIGLFTRVVTPIVWLMTLMVCHRMTGFLFGLDQIAMMLAMYLMIAPSGEVYSIDAWRKSHLKKKLERILLADGSERSSDRGHLPEVSGYGSGGDCRIEDRLSSASTIATRLIQIHLCIIYLFGGLGKMRGESWWDGSAMWLSVASFEYQSFDMTWIGRYPLVMAIAAHVTIFWETFYCCLIWSKLTRPIFLAIALAVHAGIGLFLGMMTFGWMMIVANMAFVEPQTMKGWLRMLLGNGSNRQSIGVNSNHATSTT